MNKKICFVGLEEPEVKGLTAGLFQLSPAWDCAFSPDVAGFSALLEQGPVAVLVADVRCLGHQAVELLQQTAAYHPQVLRLALGDVADREMVATSIGSPFQFVSRPWKLPDLIRLVERSLALDAWLSTDALRKLIPRLGRLPSLPSTYFQILKKTESPDSSVEGVAEIIARDPTLTARLLQTVNSAACGQARKISSAVDAVSALGLEAIKSLVLCLQVFNGSVPVYIGGIAVDQLWERSFRVAQLACEITRIQTKDDSLIADTFTAGLLHRIGQIILAAELGDVYAGLLSAARDQHQDLQTAERAALGVTNNQVGAYLLGLWGMPLSIIEAVAHFPAPTAASTREFAPVTAVHVAEVLVGEEDSSPDGLAAPHLDQEYLRSLDLPRTPGQWRRFLRGGLPRVQAQPEAAAPAVQTFRQPEEGRPRLVLAGLAAGTLLLIAAIAIPIWHRGTAEAGRTSLVAATRSENDAETRGGAQAGDGTSAGSHGRASAEVQLQAIFYRAGKSAAVINGKTLGIGQVIDGFKLVSIERSSVVLESGSDQKTVRLGLRDAGHEAK